MLCARGHTPLSHPCFTVALKLCSTATVYYHHCSLPPSLFLARWLSLSGQTHSLSLSLIWTHRSREIICYTLVEWPVHFLGLLLYINHRHAITVYTVPVHYYFKATLSYLRSIAQLGVWQFDKTISLNLLSKCVK